MFSALVRLAGRPLVINMDGVEWKRSKWSKPVQAWFWLNERIAAWAGTTLIADHPEIKRHLETRIHTSKIKMIPYGAPLLSSAPIEPLASLGVEPNRYFVSICRIEPENSLLELVRAFSSKPRSCKLLVIGDLCDRHRYHRAVRAAAGPEVVFPGSLYDRLALNSVRFHARAYCHGHTVGGTNPSLVEALGAGNAIIAHDNPFNRWTAGEDQFFFANEHACECIFDALVDDENALRLARNRAAERFEQDFQLSAVLESYERMLLEQR
jgi:glycosyltransferase involved in cell wall biosynthesis